LINLLREIMIDATNNVRNRRQKADICLALAERLKFEKREQWMIFGSCLYTFEDATMAIRAYFNTKDIDSDTDFQYLRLFGFLNATYLQLEAIKQLVEIVKLADKNRHIDKLKHHDIISTRHMLASHTLSCIGDNINGKDIYSITIEQVSLRGINVTFRVNELNEKRHINFYQLYSSWQDYIGDIMIEIIKKFVNTVFKTNKDRISYYNEKLSKMKNNGVRPTHLTKLQ